MPIRIVIADDHRLMLDALVRVLDEAEDFEVVGQTNSGAHVPPLIARHAPDMVLMDVRMPGMDGLSALDVIRERHPDVKVVLISAEDDRQQIERALSRGASGFLLKSINPADVPSALRQAFEGTSFSVLGSGASVDERVTRDVGLTERELTMLKAVARGLSNKQIGQELWVTEQTVKFHLSNVYRKLGVSNRAGAVRYAHEEGLTTRSDSG
jgi:two-component system NarL family response regulator